MKDVTSTSFGLIIAYLLPGLTGLTALSFKYPPLRNQLTVFLSADSNVGLFLIVVLFALAIGLEISAARWLIFEYIFFRHYKLYKKDFTRLCVEETLTAFRAAVDENYRYHQFWGGMAIVLPFLFCGAYSDAQLAPFTKSTFIIVLFVLLETITVVAGIVSYLNYTGRSKAILTGGKANAERMDTQKEKGQKEKGQKEKEGKEEKEVEPT